MQAKAKLKAQTRAILAVFMMILLVIMTTAAAAAANWERDVSFQTPSGTYTLHVNDRTTVEAVKAELANLTGVQPYQQTLIFRGIRLDDSATLGHYGAESGDMQMHLSSEDSISDTGLRFYGGAFPEGPVIWTAGSGTVKYTPATGSSPTTLELNGATIDGDYLGLYLGTNLPVDVVLTGNNYISGSSYGLASGRNLTIKGSGTLNVKSDGSNAGIEARGLAIQSENAVIFADRISDQSENSSWRGVVFSGQNGMVYGNCTPSGSFEIPNGSTLVIPAGRTLTIPAGVTLTNNGSIVNNGSLIISGAVVGSGSMSGSGLLNGAPPPSPGELFAPDPSTPGGGSSDDFEGQVMSAYSIIRGAAASLASVGIAVSGIFMLIGSDQEYEKAKKSIKLSLFALVAILLLPAIVNFGKAIFPQ